MIADQRATAAPRLAILTSNPVAGAGGEETFTRLLAEGLRNEGFQLTIFAATDRELDMSSGSRLWSTLHMRDVGRAWLAAQSFKKRASEFDLVIVNSLAGWALPGWPGVTIYHGTRAGFATDVQRSSNRLGYLKSRFVVGMFEKRSARGRTVIAVSASARREVETYYKLRVDCVIPNGHDLSASLPEKGKADLRLELGLPATDFLALFSGRPGRHKGTDILDRVAARLPKQMRIVSAVPTDYRADTRVIKRVGLKPPALARLYAACDAFIFPSRWEACSMSLIEAMAARLPPVASRVGHMPEVIAAEPVLDRVAPKTFGPEEFVDHLVDLYGNPGLRMLAGERAGAFAAREHDARVMAQRYGRQLERFHAASRARSESAVN